MVSGSVRVPLSMSRGIQRELPEVALERPCPRNGMYSPNGTGCLLV